jgi:hypothetical protein
MELFQNLSLVSLALAVVWLLARVKKIDDRVSKMDGRNTTGGAPPPEAKELGRSATAGK